MDGHTPMPTGSAPVAVVTGASAGIGRAIVRRIRAQRLARRAAGARARTAWRPPGPRSQALGGEALVIPTDVADETQVEAAAAQVEAEWGAIDVWVNDAMATIFSDVMKITPAGLPPRHRGHLPGRRVGHAGGAAAHEAAAARHHRAGRAPRWRTARSRCRRPTAAPRRRCAASPTRCAASSITIAARSTSPWCSCRPSTRRSSTGAAPRCTGSHGRWAGSSSPRSPRRRCTGPPPTTAAKSGWARRRCRRSLGTKLFPGFLDRLLGRTAVDGQHTDEPLPPRPSRQPVCAGGGRPWCARPLRRAGARLQRPVVGQHAPRPADRRGVGRVDPGPAHAARPLSRTALTSRRRPWTGRRRRRSR